MGLLKWPMWIAALLGALLVLAGCGNGQTDEAAEPTFADSENKNQTRAVTSENIGAVLQDSYVQGRQVLEAFRPEGKLLVSSKGMHGPRKVIRRWNIIEDEVCVDIDLSAFAQEQSNVQRCRKIWLKLGSDTYEIEELLLDARAPLVKENGTDSI